MSHVENASLAVVELAYEQEQASKREPDVAGADDKLQIGILRSIETEPREELLRRPQVLDDIQQENDVEVGNVHG